MSMDHEQELSAIAAKLSRCRELQRETYCDFTRDHLAQLASQLETELYKLDEQHRRLG